MKAGELQADSAEVLASYPTVRRCAPGRERLRHGFTLPEVLLAMVLATGVLAALGHVVRQVTVTTTSLETRSEAQTQASLLLVRMRGELGAARSILSLSTQKVVFVHPDVTGDSAVDVITYEWSGTPGADLTRAVNSDAGETLLANCQAFTITDVRATTTEELLAGHEAYEPSVAAVCQQYSAGATAPAAEVFVVNRAGAGSFRITRVQLDLEPLTPGGSGNLSVSLVSAPGGTPGASPIEMQTKPIAQLCTSGWQDFCFGSNTGLTLGVPHALVIRPSGTSVVLAVNDQIVSGDSATPNDFFRWSTTGSSWPVITDMASRDLHYKVFGRYVDTSGQPLPIQNAPISLLEIHLEAGTGSSRFQLDSAVECVNRPEVQP